MLIHVLRDLLFLTKQSHGWGIHLSEGNSFLPPVYYRSLYRTPYWGNRGRSNIGSNRNYLPFRVSEKMDRIFAVRSMRTHSFYCVTYLSALPENILVFIHRCLTKTAHCFTES